MIPPYFRTPAPQAPKNTSHLACQNYTGLHIHMGNTVYSFVGRHTSLHPFHIGNKGVQGGPSTIVKVKLSRHTACAVNAIHTFVRCAGSYGIGLFVDQIMGEWVTHGVPMDV